MLYIKRTPTSEVTWHIGEPFPAITGPIYLLQADCDELNFIQTRFKGLPQVLDQNGFSCRTQIWTGDWATYIAHNMVNIVPQQGEVYLRGV